MSSHEYTKLRIVRANGVSTVSIDNPPVNVLDVSLTGELRRFLLSIREDDATRVVVLESGNPDFFIAHVDMAMIDDPHAFDEIARDLPAGLNVFQALGDGACPASGHDRQTCKSGTWGRGRVFGRVRHGIRCDRPRRLRQVEALMGTVPSGGAMQYLSTRMSRGRVLEIILGAELFGAEDAAAYGWINRALPPGELDGFVDDLAHNIAALPEGVARGAKRVLPPADLMAGFTREEEEWRKLFANPTAERLIRGGLEQGAQTLKGEERLEDILRGIKT